MHAWRPYGMSVLECLCTHVRAGETNEEDKRVATRCAWETNVAMSDEEVAWYAYTTVI